MKLNRVYKDFVLGTPHYISILYGGSSSGKSHAITEHIILQCLSSKQTIWVFRKRQVDLKDSVIALFLQLLNEDDIDYTYKPSILEIHIGESIIKFRGLDDPERIKSAVGISLVWCEECTELSPDDVDQLFLRLRDINHPPRFIFSFNPISKSNYVYRYFFDTSSPEYMLEGKDVYILKTTWKDNRSNLPQSTIDHLINLYKTKPYYATVYCDGNFGVLGKLIFPQGTYSIKALDVPLGTKQIWGCDPGVTDKFAITGSYYIKSTNTLYTYKEFCQSEVLCKTVADWVKSNVPKACTVYTDNAGKAQIQELQALGCTNMVSNTKPPGSVQADIDKLLSLNWVINPSCVNLIKDLQYYSYEKDKKTGLYLNEPARETDGYHCDALDSVRYALQSISSDLTVTKFKSFKGL